MCWCSILLQESWQVWQNSYNVQLYSLLFFLHLKQYNYVYVYSLFINLNMWTAAAIVCIVLNYTYPMLNINNAIIILWKLQITIYNYTES